MNNRKNKEKQNQTRPTQDNIKYIEPIQPKFNPNWTTNIRCDRIILNISDCTYDVVSKVCKELKFKTQKDSNNSEWDVWWTDWHVLPETLAKMEHHQKINHFPGMFVLSRKNLLAKNLMRMRKKCINTNTLTDDYNFFPLTWNLPLQYNEFKTYFQTKPKGKTRTYIIKPQSMSQGKGIFLTRKLQDIDPKQHCVIQRYISKPYLIDGLKFDLRIYVLVASVDPLQIYIYEEGLARFATEQYIGPNKDNMQDICMHLTNYAINKDSNKFVFNSDQKDMNVGHKRSLTSAYERLKQDGVDVEVLKGKINEIIVKALISGLSHLKFQYKSCQAENYRSDMCFELLGFDIILNDQADPFLLQINYTPSFSTDTPLDLNIKKNLIKDTLVLLEINKKFKERTVKARIQHKNQRMLTGKKMKLTPEQKVQKKEEALKERQEYSDLNLGGFTRLYPIPEQQNLTSKYENLIKMQGETGNQKKVKKDSINSCSPLMQNITHRRSEKINKLPQIVSSNASNSTKENPLRKFSAAKISSQQRIFDTAKTSSSQDRILVEEPPSQKRQRQKSSYNKEEKQILCSDKIIQKLKVRDIYPKKKIQARQTLVPKAIQFQGNKYDGLSSCYRIELNNRQ